MNNNELILTLKSKLATDARWAQRALLRIYKEQTETEQCQDNVLNLNMRGFRSCDAFILSKFAKQFQDRKWLSDKQMAIVFKKIPVYARQLIKLTGANVIKEHLK